MHRKTPTKLLRYGSNHHRQRHQRSVSERSVYNDYIIEERPNGTVLVFAPFIPKTHAGDYYCQASDTQNSISIMSKSVTLKRPTGPKQEFEEYMTGVEALAGNNIVLNCTQPVRAEPAIYKWKYRKSQIWEEFSDIEVSKLPQGKFVTTPNGNLYLYNVNRNFAGDFRCTTVNELLGREAVTGYYYRLDVRTPKSPQTPVISHFPWFSSIVVQAGQPLTLECNAQGAPKPQIAWRFSSSASLSSPNYRRSLYKHKIETVHEGILTINSVSTDDSGIYACELEPAGSEIIKTVNVTVVEPVQLTISHGILNNASKIDLHVGVSSTIKCSLSRPLMLDEEKGLRLSWLKNGDEISYETAGVRQDGMFSICTMIHFLFILFHFSERHRS